MKSSTTMTLGLINARGGSKGVPRKNVRLLEGRPLIQYTIESALLAKSLDKVVVSTDDPEIAAVSQHAGAEVPFSRPKRLATDSASQVDVTSHALSWYRQQGTEFERVVLLQPVCPFRLAEDIDAAVEILDSPRVGSVISVTDAESFHPATMYTADNPDGFLEPMFGSSFFGVRRQDLPKVWWRNGLIYAFRTKDFFQFRSMEINPVQKLIIPPERSVNIDSLADWEIAASLVSQFKKSAV